MVTMDGDGPRSAVEAPPPTRCELPPGVSCTSHRGTLKIFAWPSSTSSSTLPDTSGVVVQVQKVCLTTRVWLGVVFRCACCTLRIRTGC